MRESFPFRSDESRRLALEWYDRTLAAMPFTPHYTFRSSVGTFRFEVTALGACHAHKEGELVRASLPPRAADAPLTPMYRQPLGPDVLQALETFEASFVDTGTSGPAVDWLRRHYRPEATVAGAFAGAMAELLAPFGILCLDSTHHAVKAAAAREFYPLWKQAREDENYRAMKVLHQSGKAGYFGPEKQTGRS